jgi:hypothetical protein
MTLKVTPVSENTSCLQIKYFIIICFNLTYCFTNVNITITFCQHSNTVEALLTNPYETELWSGNRKGWLKQIIPEITIKSLKSI